MKLEFEKAKGNPKKGMFVALHNEFPIKTKDSLGLIVEIRKPTVGFDYRVLEFHDNKTYWHHISNIIPLKTKWFFEA